MKSKFYYIFGCIILGILPILVLKSFSSTRPRNTNGFIRKFPPHFLTYQNIFNKNLSNSYIAGLDSTTLYLGYSNTQLKLVRFQWRTNQFLKTTLKINDHYPIAWKALKTIVSEHHLYLMEGLTPNILEGTINSSVLNRKNCYEVSFTGGFPISQSQWVFKTIDKQRNQQVLGLLKTGSKTLYIPKKNLKKQVDGYFDVDGYLIFNKESKRIVYTYRYRNGFMVFDPDLKYLYTGETIDPFYQAQIKVGRIKDHGKEIIKLASPPFIVNKKSYSQGTWLFVNSNIVSKNEDKARFHSKSVIDIYALEGGAYKYSFYIPSYKENIMKDFAFNNNTLAVLYDQGIIIFKMNIAKN